MDEFIIIGAFETHTAARGAIASLRQAGFTIDQIGMVSRNSETGAIVTDHPSGLALDPTGTQWEEGASVGAATGALAGAGWGLAVMAGVLPGIGPAIAGGALVAILASTTAGAAAGSLVGGLLGLGIPEDDADYYQHLIGSGRTLVSVHPGNRLEEARLILESEGATTRILRGAPVAATSGETMS